MAGRLLLDTSAVVELFRSQVEADRLADGNGEVFVSAVVIGELLAGALRSERREQNLAQVERLASGPNVLDCDADTARHYAAIRDKLRLKGRPIPEKRHVDRRIGAAARSYPGDTRRSLP